MTARSRITLELGSVTVIVPSAVIGIVIGLVAGRVKMVEFLSSWEEIGQAGNYVI